MCGIFCHVSKHRRVELSPDDADRLSRRGPDALRSHEVTTTTGGHEWLLTFSSSVLALRGDQIQAQPVIDEATGSVFCWNGEAWLFNGSRLTGNDTDIVSKHLFQSVPALPVEEALTQVLRKIAGPYAFVFYDAKSSQLYFGRDGLGRRSLLISHGSGRGDELTVSSVAVSTSIQEAHEVEAPFIYCVDLKEPQLTISVLAPSAQPPNMNRILPESNIVPEATPTADAIRSLIQHLQDSLLYRVDQIPTYTVLGQSECPSKVAVLFSGGLDCTLLARLTHDILPLDQPVDLLNVAFENPRVVNARAAEQTKSGSTIAADAYESCPDRMTGRSTFAELLKVCPQREWRFVAVNVSYKEFLDHKAGIVHLMHPHNTEMDLSITAALYFAARGQGEMISTSQVVGKGNPYTTTARVLLSGLGADELFGGYARHAAAFTRGGYEALIEELELDFTRIAKRNLGRDDRVIAHWGRETRYPFLDETFVKFVLQLPAWEKCGFRPGKAVPKHFEATTVPEQSEDLHPEKMLLRCAMWQLGMKGAAAEKKRAIQFGARTAKMHGGRTKGTDIVTVVDGSIRGT